MVGLKDGDDVIFGAGFMLGIAIAARITSEPSRLPELSDLIATAKDAISPAILNAA